MSRCLMVLPALWVVGAACSGDSTAPICDAVELADALDSAESGDTVRVGTCRLEGSFTVPGGVTLQGEGREASVIVGPEIVTGGAAEVAVRLVPGDPPARLLDVAIESGSNYAVGASGGGAVEIARVDVRASHGWGLGAEGLDHLALEDVELVGSVDPADPDPPADDAASHGLVLIRVAQADLRDVIATHFAKFGAMLVGGATTWAGGGTYENVSTGLLVSEGTALLDGLDLGRTLQRTVNLDATIGAVFLGGASVDTAGVSLEGGEGYGLVHDSGQGRHVDLVARGNSLAAVWAQNVDQLELSGTGSVLEDNGQAGVVALESANVTVRDARIAATRLVPTIGYTAGEPATVQVGDGIQLVGTVSGVLLEALELEANERVGLLIDLDGRAGEGITLRDVSVEGTGVQLGAIEQGGDAPEGWDAEVTRGGATSANDEAQRSRVGVAGIIEPCTVRDAAGEIADSGLPGL